MKAKKSTLYRAGAVTFISLLLLAGALLPAQVRAGIFADFFAAITGTADAKTEASDSVDNLQTFALPQPAMNIDPTPARGGGNITIVDSSALLPQEGPAGTIADIEKPSNGTITRYIVKSGDTVSTIAELFGVSQGTILSANDLGRGSTIRVGQELIIFPITGIPYTVRSGDTIASIAKRYGGDPTEVANYNGIDDTTLVVGSEIIIPNGEVPATATVAKPKSTVKTSGKSVASRAGIAKEPAHGVGARGTASENAYYVAPLANYIETQGIHGYNSVDLGAPKGTPIVASAAGDVVVARSGGWNGGYGSYVVVSHDNGSQTLYAHMSKVATYDGATVTKGQIIGYVGATGLATGPHLHFEIRNGIRNPF
ncbi:MAG TPA: peptidoglycan DD-metalloendopeptidase family protein [Candidatus Paceibacterota bacterium]